MGVFHFPVKIVSAEGCLNDLSQEVNNLGAKRPLILTDPGVVSAGIVDKVTKNSKGEKTPYAVFDGVEPDPKIRNVAEAVEVIRKGDHDLLIGLGGGSSIDAAKAASILCTNDGDLREFQGPREQYPKRPLPLITIPTTAGTGSEVSSAAVIVDEEKQYKMFFKSPQIFSRVAFLDAAVLEGIPGRLAAETGADTLTHALESYFNPNRTPVTEAVSLSAVELVFSNLRAFVANTRNRQRAQNMLNASSLAGIAMTTAGLGLVHGIAHPLGVRGRIGHGLACGLLLPKVLRYSWLAASDQYLRLARTVDWRICVGHPKERDVALKVIEEVECLLDDIGLPKKLSEINASLDDTAAVIEEAYSSFLNQVNPRAASRRDIEEIILEIS